MKWKVKNTRWQCICRCSPHFSNIWITMGQLRIHFSPSLDLFFIVVEIIWHLVLQTIYTNRNLIIPINSIVRNKRALLHAVLYLIVVSNIYLLFNLWAWWDLEPNQNTVWALKMVRAACILLAEFFGKSRKLEGPFVLGDSHVL